MPRFVIGVLLATPGVMIVIYNLYLRTIRGGLYRFVGGKTEKLKYVSVVGIAGSILLALAALMFHAQYQDVMWICLLAACIDPGGVLWSGMLLFRQRLKFPGQRI
jgi:hypothetical protein